MSAQITITLPAIDESVIATIETLSTETAATETAAFAALREKYAPLAKHNGYIKIASYSMSTSNYSRSEESYYEEEGKRVRAFLAVDDFDSDHTDQNRGNYTGTRLYLTEHGQWLRIERSGSWSQWQGEADGWGCEAADPGETGSVDPITDSFVASKYHLHEVIEGLGKALTTLAEKLPQRMTKLQQRASLAAQLLASLNEGKKEGEVCA